MPKIGKSSDTKFNIYKPECSVGEMAMFILAIKIKQIVHKLICIFHNIYIPCLYENVILYSFSQDFLLICALLAVMIQRI